MEMYLFLTLD